MSDSCLIPEASETFPLCVTSLDKPQVLALPPGFAAKVFLPERLAEHVQQSVCLENVMALETYLQWVVTDPSALAIYVQTKGCGCDKNCILAVLDHAPNAGNPGRNVNTAALNLRYSADFAPLAKVLGQAQSQLNFVDFVEQNAHLFHEAMKLQELAANFSSVDITSFKSAVNLQNGNFELSYATAEDPNAKVKLPGEVTVTAAIFTGQDEIELTLLLRTCREGGKLAFRLVLPGFEKILNDEVTKLESRLQVWLSGLAAKASEKSATEVQTLDWSKALLVRGIPTLGNPVTKAHVLDMAGLQLPPGYGGAAVK